MFVLSQDNALFRGIATLVTIALVLWGVGMHVHKAQAANLTSVSDTLSDSAPSVLADHEIAFTVPTGSAGIDAAGEQIVITFPAGFGMGSVAFTDIDIEVNTTDGTIVDGLSPAANQWGFDLTGQVLTLESGGGTATATALDNVVIKVGTNADGPGVNQITNHAVAGASYEVTINVAGGQDTGRTRVAIVDTVLVTARVDTSFDFTVIGYPTTAGIAVNGTSTTGTSSATSLPFGTVVAGEIYTLAQTLNVETNASNGFVVTGEVDQQLTSTAGDIDAFADAVFADPAVWATPGNNINDENTWGHWGWTTQDTTTPRTTEFGSNEWEGASTSPVALFGHTGPADAQTDGVGSTTVGFQLEITALQEAADDYSAVLTYIATPTF